VVPGLLGLGLTAGRHLAAGSKPAQGSVVGDGGQRLVAALVLLLGVALFGNGIVQRVT
jgi:hypothetical protein